MNNSNTCQNEAQSDDTQQRMNKTVELLKEEFLSIHSGRVNSSQFEKLIINYADSSFPLIQLASIRVIDTRTVVITPYDPAAFSQIDQVLRKIPNIGNPSNDGESIKIVVPQLTEERRHEYVKQARTKAEEARVSARNIRRKARAALESADLAKDDIIRREKDLDNLTKKTISSIDDLLKHKESELFKI